MAAQRARVGVGEEPEGGPLIPNLVSLIEQNSQDPVPITFLPLPEGVAGAYIRREGRPFIFVSSSTWPVRRRFTIAHEYGHHVLGHAPKIDTVDDLRDWTTQIEVEANAFAAEFLAPANAVRRWMAVQAAETGGPGTLETLVRLAHHFGISAESARYRVEDAGVVTDRPTLKWLDGAIKAAEHKPVQKKLGLAEHLGSPGRDDVAEVELGARRQPSVVTKQVLTIAGNGLLQPERISELIEVPLDALENLFKERGIAVPPEDDDLGL